MKKKDYRTSKFNGATIGIVIGVFLGTIFGPEVGLASIIFFGLTGLFIGWLIEKKEKIK